MSQEAALVDADLNLDSDAAGVRRRASSSPTGKADDLPGRFSRADAGAFEELVETHQGQVARLAHRLLGWRGGSEVEDVVQDVFLAAFSHRARFRGHASLSTWLTAITVNRCRSRQRRLRLWWRWFNRQGGAEPASPAPPLDHRLASDETSTHVRSAVQRLPPRDREVVVLRYFEGLSSPDIATLTRQSTNAVEVRLHRVREACRNAGTVGPERAVMNDDRLSNLLWEMDATSLPPPLAGLAAAVRSRARARSRRRRALITAAVLLLPAGGALSWALRSGQPVNNRALVHLPPSTVNSVAPQVEAARLTSEVDLQVAVATRLHVRRDQRERVARATQRLAAAEHSAGYLSERDQAALTLLDHGDRLRRDLQQVDAAVRAYRRTIELFPESQWAAVARERISQIKPRAAASSAGYAA